MQSFIFLFDNSLLIAFNISFPWINLGLYPFSNSFNASVTKLAALLDWSLKS